MKKLFIVSLGFLIVFFLSVTKSYAFDPGAEFLLFGIGARPCGMGEAFVAIADDVTAPFWNPAGLATLKKSEFGAMHSEIADSSLEFLGFSAPYGHGSFGINAIGFINDPIPRTSESGQLIGEIKWSDFAFIFSYGQKLFKGFSLGLGLRIIHTRISDPIFDKILETTYAGDMGFIYNVSFCKGLNLGGALLNAGTKLQLDWKEDELPRTIRLGASYKRKFSTHDSLIFALDMHKILDDKWRPNIGVEFKLREILFLRTGYYEKEGSIEGLTYGVGVKIKNFQIDWANVPVSEMIGYERSNKISIATRF